ncbi:MAG: eukaryotic-like serine/threonine-protein kinase [Mycobacterium sp.]|jgi:serine/threonine-protein kinase|nr:eukaryotic-like serine/threonine-protein kinase [Mycobacterium sp.]
MRTAITVEGAQDQTWDETVDFVVEAEKLGPGPWRHLATPSVTEGRVFCGIVGGRPLVVWTNDAELLLARTQSENTAAPGLDQLYAWWASHS